MFGAILFIYFADRNLVICALCLFFNVLKRWVWAFVRRIQHWAATMGFCSTRSTLGLCSTYLALGLCSTYLYFLSFFNVLNCYTLIPPFSLIFSLMRNMKFQFIILIFSCYIYNMFDSDFRKCFYSF